MLAGLSGSAVLLSPGDEADLDQAEALRLIAAGFAVPLGRKPERAVKRKGEKR